MRRCEDVCVDVGRCDVFEGVCLEGLMNRVDVLKRTDGLDGVCLRTYVRGVRRKGLMLEGVRRSKCSSLKRLKGKQSWERLAKIQSKEEEGTN